MKSSADAELGALATRRSTLFLTLLTPALLFVAVDFLWRGERIVHFERSDYSSYGLSFLWSSVCWGALYFSALATTGRIRAILGTVFTFCLTVNLGSQAYFFQQYNAYINRDVARYATNFTESVLHQVGADAGNYLSFNLPALGVALALLFGGRFIVPSLKRGQQLASLLGVSIFLLSMAAPVQHARRQASTPDMLYMNAVGVVSSNLLGLSPDSGKNRPRARASLSIAPLRPKRSAERNVVFVILESIRKDAVCNAFDSECKETPFTNRLFPERTPLSQMRALSSSTAISMAVLWAGIAPTQSREVLHTAPLLFDYARRAGYQTGYFTSQSILFGNMRLWLDGLAADLMFTGTDVDPECDIDLGVSEDLFAERAIEEVNNLKEPFFLTIQLSNGHYPYLVREDAPRPFQPSTTSKAPEKNEKFFNYYKNAVHQQDQHLARVLRTISESKAGARTVVVYTSDHGEAFREHHQMGHTFSVLDEEVLVPAWIHAPEGTLSTEERRTLSEKTDAFTFHPDLTATILDLLGIWKDPALAPHKAHMIGTSLMSEGPNERALPMTNCSPLWSCAFENWGIMRKNMKLEARAWDSNYHCWDLSLDPSESVNLGEDACGVLPELAEKTFGRIPGHHGEEN